MQSLSWTTVVATIALAMSPASASVLGSTWSQDAEAIGTCITEADRDPGVQSLTGKLVRRDPTMSQIADETLPTVVQARAVELRSRREKPCRDLTLAAVRKHRPPLVSAYQIRFHQMDMVYLQLIQRRIAFGNANRLLHEAYLAFSMREDQFLQAQSEADRRALGESLDRLSQQTQSTPPPTGTGRMTCRWVGPTLYCDPY